MRALPDDLQTSGEQQLTGLRGALSITVLGGGTRFLCFSCRIGHSHSLGTGAVSRRS
jgi:hypothetical protein